MAESCKWRKLSTAQSQIVSWQTWHNCKWNARVISIKGPLVDTGAIAKHVWWKNSSACKFLHWKRWNYSPMMVQWWSNDGPMMVQWWSNGLATVGMTPLPFKIPLLPEHQPCKSIGMVALHEQQRRGYLGATYQYFLRNPNKLTCCCLLTFFVFLNFCLDPNRKRVDSTALFLACIQPTQWIDFVSSWVQSIHQLYQRYQRY